VTVYPFEDQYPAQYPAMSPPSDEYRPFPSPFGGPIQTPVPMPSYESGAYEASPPGGGNVGRIYFGHGSSRLNEAGRQIVDHAARAGGPLTVDGHASQRAEVADPAERDIVNLEMSMKRAVKVSSDLIRSGVPVERIETRAFGDARPAAPIAGADEEAASRRVEIHTQDGAVFPMTSSYQPPADSDRTLTEPAPIPPLSRY
jgi:hypothetical protein